MQFYVVGSALYKKHPRDVDLLGVMDDMHFKTVFGMAADEFLEQRRSGEEWGSNLLKWKEQTLGATRVLQFIFPELVPIDFKIIPRSLLREPHREVNMTMPTITWRIGLPDLSLQVKEF